ncbi:hypothetical protein ABIE44_001017 [Marmoricola sp. OAE513]|uniref:hypothetical protein n=1 Tax=Marmoricola sp. OAE513 TaxID=2817894 RepID=UPI001AE2FDC8
MNSLLITLVGFVPLADPAPAADDVKAGWGAFAIFIALAIAVAFLGWSLTKHLKKAKLNADAGAFGDVPAENATAETSTRD